MGDAAVTLASAKAAIEAAMTDHGELYDKWHQDITDHTPSQTWRPNDAATIRDMLLHAALLGLIDADLAEALSKDLIGQPLANVPKDADFDARSDADWTLPMAVAWVMARDWRGVTRQKADFRREFEHWTCTPKRGLPKDGRPGGYVITSSWTIGDLGHPSINGLIAEDDIGEDVSAVGEDYIGAGVAKPLLWRALQVGALTASGRCDGASRQAIPAMLWQDLQPILERWDGPETIRAGMGDPTWLSVTVRRVDVLELWPATSALQVIPVAVTGESGDTPAHRMILRAVQKSLWPDVDWRDLPVKIRNDRINDWAERHGGQRYGDSTIQRALRDLR